MESLSVRVRNPFALKESLQVALEVAWPDLPPDRVCHVRAFLGQVPTLIHPVTLQVGRLERLALLACSRYFLQSRTAYWLREDFITAIRELERELQACAT